MGKTTAAVDLINRQLRKQIDFWFCICPTWEQKTFDSIRDLFRTGCVHQDLNPSTFARVIGSIQNIKQTAERKGHGCPSFCLLIDDASGSSLIHANRKGMFANIAVRNFHLNLTIIIVSHQPTSVDPNFRNNCENIILFPSETKDTHDWIIRNYGMGDKSPNMGEIISKTWGGALDKNPEWGKHFLYIHMAERSRSRFFVDFDTEIR